MNHELDNYMCAKSSEEAEYHKKSFEFFQSSSIKIKSISNGSIIWTLEFTSGLSLAVFWSVYSTGLLREMINEDFVTKEVLDEANLQSAKLDLSVNENDFKACKEEIEGNIRIYICTTSFYDVLSY